MQSASSSDGQSSGDEEDESSRLSLGLPSGAGDGDEESCSRSPSLNDQPIVDQSDLLPHDLQQMEKDKAAIYKHPLFPLVGESV